MLTGYPESGTTIGASWWRCEINSGADVINGTSATKLMLGQTPWNYIEVESTTCL
jgi:hypothetical protein